MDLAVSVIIPTYNRADALIETLTALVRCEVPEGGWEAIVVDDGSTDNTESAVQTWIAASNAPVRYFQQLNAGPARARNLGAASAHGRVLIFIDNDIVVEPGFLRSHLETLGANPGSWLIGRIRHPPQLRETAFGRYRDDQWEQFYLDHKPGSISETEGMTAANFSLPADDFKRLGGFDEGFSIASCEDAELGMRARKSGVRVLFHPGIVVLHNDWAVDLERFCDRQRLYSISDVRLWRIYGDQSPRVRMIRENGPVDLRKDGIRLILKKLFKGALTTSAGGALLRFAIRSAEKSAPDRNITRRLYDLAIGVAIFRGVREGMARYRPGS